jgi:hypothetical protein
MHQTLKKIKNLFADKKTPQQNTGSFKRPHLKLVSSPSVIPSDKIAERAFIIWQERGCSHGNHFEDWLLAKLQLEDELN